MATITIDPITRIEGHFKLEVETGSGGAVTSARVAGQLYRDFENILVGRAAYDPVHLTQRICGVCPVSHAIAAVQTVEKAVAFKPNRQALLLRALIHGGDFVQDHILHFYHLNLMDYVQGPDMPPWNNANTADLRITGADRDRLIAHYIQALAVRRRGQELVGILAGKIPHVATVIPGGVTQSPTSAQMAAVKSLIAEMRSFIHDVYVPDAEFVAGKYPDYFHIGRGSGNLLSFGVIDLPGGTRFLKRGRVLRRRGGSVQPRAAIGTVDVRRIVEDVRHSYYSGTSGKNPSVGLTVPSFGKADAYSWLKAPRYLGGVYEVGALARMTVSRAYSGGVSVMDRTLARAYEARKIVDAMGTWAKQVRPGAKSFTTLGTINGTAFGLTEAPRGALGHWAKFSAGKVTRYQVIPATNWNASPRDGRNVPGTMEQALTGTPVADIARPIELMRVVHSFDPCVGCAVHVIDVDSGVAHEHMVGTGF